MPFFHFHILPQLFEQMSNIYFKGRNFNFIFFISFLLVLMVFWSRITFVSYLAYIIKVKILL